MSGALRPTGSSPPAEESFFDLLIDTLEGLDRSARGLFLQRLLQVLTQVELDETRSTELWDRLVERRREWSRVLGRPVSLRTALVDVFSSEQFLRAPILVEYQQLKKLQINAATDALTGIYNRRLFDEYLDKELNRAQRYAHTLALMILDLHAFKQVNDRWGHLRGDQVLQLAASSLRKSMRTSDFAFRIGGDEFALLLPQTDAEQAATVGHRLHTQFASDIAAMQIELPLAFDYGVAVYPQDGQEASELMRVADQRLYQMKGTGRNGGRRVTPAPGAPMGVPAAPPEEAPRDAAQATPAPASTLTPTPRPEGVIERRKAERISLAQTHADAQLAWNAAKVRILDISSGGLSLETEQGLELKETFPAVLHVPILPAVRVSLRVVYQTALGRGFSRVGCAFLA
jgi:diguanylate cyclase (GGDEF)-like protein